MPHRKANHQTPSCDYIPDSIAIYSYRSYPMSRDNSYWSYPQVGRKDGMCAHADNGAGLLMNGID